MNITFLINDAAKPSEKIKCVEGKDDTGAEKSFTKAMEALESLFDPQSLQNVVIIDVSTQIVLDITTLKYFTFITYIDNNVLPEVSVLNGAHYTPQL